ncbi:hypothetical protein ACFWFF_12780 [Streptomyces sp. NPDC060223]|uniref:hypothetical protein n=1 Tax=unclassified Streptomyces TaxID=2593676 RepID=UPI00363F67FC
MDLLDDLGGASEDVRRGVPEEEADLRALEDLVVAGDVPMVGGAGAVVGVSLDLDGQSFGPEEEVQAALAAAGREEFGLGLWTEARVVHA